MSPKTSVLLLSFALALPALAQPLTTAFTYQGELASSGSPAAGPHDFQFALFDAPDSGAQVGPTLCADNVTLHNGRFTVSLDFGPAFTGQARYLEVRVRADTGLDCSNQTGFTSLAPRQNLTIAPNAGFALAALTASDASSFNGQPSSFYTSATNLSSGTLPSARLSGTYAAPLNLTNLSNVFTGSGAGLSGLNAANIASGILAPSRGGAGTNLALTGGARHFVKQTAVGAPLSTGLISTSELPTIFLGGDLSGSTGAATVAGLRGTAVSAAAPGNNQVLTYNGSQWAPAVLPVQNPAVGGDLSGLASNAQIVANAVGPAELASNAASLARVTGGAASVSGSTTTFAGPVVIPATTRVMSVGPTAFIPVTGGIVYPSGGLYFRASAAGSVEAIAPLNFPHGATITSVTGLGSDSDSVQDFTVELRRKPLNLGALPTSMTSASSSGTPGAIALVDTSIASAVIDNQTYAYYLSVAFDAPTVLSNISFLGARIYYEVTAPLP